MINEFTDADLDCEDCDDYTTCKPCDPLDLFSIDEDELWTNIGALIIIIFGLRTIGGFLLFYYCKTGKGRA